MSRLVCAALVLSAVAIGQTVSAQTPPPNPPPVPKPFPVAGAPPATTATAAKAADQPGVDNAAAPAQVASLVPIPGDPPVYPGAEFIRMYDAGRNQRFYLFGTNLEYAQIVDYYKGILKNGGRELSRTPAIQQFELGRFDEQTMAYPPSIVVKDHTWNGSPGYLVVEGTTTKRYRTVIQIVPASGRRP